MNDVQKNLLAVEGLDVHIGKRAILHNIAFEVKPGEIVGIIGPNGSGKTTLLNTISGFMEANAGTISFAGEDIEDLEPHQRAQRGLCRGFQHAGIFRDMTVEENLLLTIEIAEKFPWWWSFSGKKRAHADRLVNEVLADADLAAHKKALAGLLSGGQLRLLELARLRLARGKLLLIDEPTAGVAPILRNKLSDIISGLVKQRGHTALIIEHDMRFLFGIADRIIVLVDGEKYLEGTPDEVRGDERLKKVYLGE